MSEMKTVFQDLPSTASRLDRPPFTAMEFEAGTILFREGDVRRSMHFLTEGRVEILVAGEVVATLEAGAVFGEIALFTETVRTATVRAVRPTSTRMLDLAGFDLLRANEPQLAGWIEGRALVQLLSRLRQLVSDARLDATEDDPVTAVSELEAPGTRVLLPDNVLSEAIRSVLPGLDEEGVAALLPHVRVQVYAAHQNLAPCGIRDFRYGLLLAGEIRTGTPTPGGALPFTSVQVGEAIGFIPAVDGRPRPLHLVTAVPSTVLWVEPAFAREHLPGTGLGPGLREPLIASLASTLTRANVRSRLRERLTARVQGMLLEPPEPPSLDSSTPFRPLPLERPFGFADADTNEWDTWFAMGTTIP